MPDLIGLVSYADDGLVFRKVYPQPGDPLNILDDPKWITEGCDPVRQAVMEKVSPDDPRAQDPMDGQA